VNGWPAPATRKLGAKRVEVAVRQQAGSIARVIETWPATAREFTQLIAARARCRPIAFREEQAGAGQPFMNIVDCRLPISDLRMVIGQGTIGNWKLEIGNEL
jgi:hypothetical protein